MRFETIAPVERLRPYIKKLVISENDGEQVYKVLPSTGLVIGFQYRGQLASLRNGMERVLDSAGITGLSDRFKLFRNSPGTGTILVYFTETGMVQFSNMPANELFNESVSLDHLFHEVCVDQAIEQLQEAVTDQQRIKVVERFLLTQLKERAQDRVVVEAVKLIYQSKGGLRMKELAEKLYISQSPFEKRFKKVVGTTPKKFASIVRFNTVINELGKEKSLTEICYEHHFFDQSHFIKDFKQYTGDTPEHFKHSL